MSFMVAFGLVGIMLCVAMILRTKIPFFRTMLVPSSVLAGILGMLVLNTGLITLTDANMFATIVGHLFTVIFISIGLTGTSKTKEQPDSDSKEILKGSIGLGMIWNMIFAFTPVVGALVVLAIGGYFGMSAVYGLLIPFGFAQGPGQAVVIGTIFEQQYGIENAAMVSLTFASIGFLACFAVGVPLAKYGLKKGLAKGVNRDNGNNEFIERGYYKKDEESSSLGNETMFSGNMDTLSFHFAVIGVCFLMALGIGELVKFIPGLGPTLGALLFLYGMIAGYIVKFILKKLKIDYMLDNTLQTKVTGWSTDYLVVTAFMAIQFSLIVEWAIPILAVSVVVTAVTFFIVLYFGQRLGGEDDFSRTLGLFGAATGTVPSGIALVRIIDPSLRTNTPVELGLMNLPMLCYLVSLSTILAIAGGALSLTAGLLILLIPIPVYLIILKIFKVWGNKTYHIKEVNLNRKIVNPNMEKEII